MAITDLTGYTWVGNETLSSVGSPFTWMNSSTDQLSLSFTSNGNNYTAFGNYFISQPIKSQFIGYDSTKAYCYVVGWMDEAYKTILITGGSDVTNTTLISWLEANGTLIPPAPASYESTVTNGTYELISQYANLDNNDNITNIKEITINNIPLINSNGYLDTLVYSVLGSDEMSEDQVGISITSTNSFISMDSYLPEVGDEWVITFEVTNPAQLTGVTATLLALTPLIFVGGVLSYFLVKTNLKKED